MTRKFLIQLHVNMREKVKKASVNNHPHHRISAAWASSVWSLIIIFICLLCHLSLSICKLLSSFFSQFFFWLIFLFPFLHEIVSNLLEATFFSFIYTSSSSSYFFLRKKQNENTASCSSLSSLSSLSSSHFIHTYIWTALFLFIINFCFLINLIFIPTLKKEEKQIRWWW